MSSSRAPAHRLPAASAAGPSVSLLCPGCRACTLPFALLTRFSRSRCTAVSRAWRTLLSMHHAFWEELQFERGMAPGDRAMCRILQNYANGLVTRLVVKDTKGLKLSVKALNVLVNQLSVLRHLELLLRTDRSEDRIHPSGSGRGPVTPAHKWSLEDGRGLTKCESLTLQGIWEDHPTLLPAIIHHARTSLKTMSLLSAPLALGGAVSLEFPVMPNLTCVNIGSPLPADHACAIHRVRLVCYR